MLSLGGLGDRVKTGEAFAPVTVCAYDLVAGGGVGNSSKLGKFETFEGDGPETFSVEALFKGAFPLLPTFLPSTSFCFLNSSE